MPVRFVAYRSSTQLYSTVCPQNCQGTTTLCFAFFHIPCCCYSSCATSCHNLTRDRLPSRLYVCLVYKHKYVVAKLYKYAMWPLTISLTTFTLTFSFTILFASRHYFPHHTQLKMLLILYEVCTLLIAPHFFACALRCIARLLSFFPFNSCASVGVVHHLSVSMLQFAILRWGTLCIKW